MLTEKINYLILLIYICDEKVLKKKKKLEKKFASVTLNERKISSNTNVFQKEEFSEYRGILEKQIRT